MTSLYAAIAHASLRLSRATDYRTAIEWSRELQRLRRMVQS